MQTEAFVGFLADNGIPVFTLEDAVKILHKSNDYAALFLHRCVKMNLIRRAERGLYYLEGRSNEYEVASHVLNPSYVSMISALSFYGLTTQIPNTIYVVSPKRHRRIENVHGYTIIFRRMKTEMMFGYHKESNGNIFIADPEKAIVDSIYLNDVDELDHSTLDRPARINIDKLVSYAERTNDVSVINGVITLLKGHKYGKQIRRLENFIRIGDGV